MLQYTVQSHKQVRLENTKNLSDLKVVVFLCGFAWQLYWSWPMLSMFKELVVLTTGSLTPKMLRSIMKKLKEEFKTEKVRRGQLASGAPGAHPCSNPSERRPGWVRYEQLCKDWRKWWSCSAKLAELLSSGGKITIAALLSELRIAKMTAYSGSDTQYASVRFVRMLVHVSGKSFADSLEDWRILRSMSPHVRGAVLHYGLQRHEDAVAMRDAMRRSNGSAAGKYSLSDLVIYLCLLRNPEEKKY
jgi:hypothetical protein